MMTADGSGSPRSEQSENENWEVVGHSSQSGDAHLIAPAAMEFSDDSPLTLHPSTEGSHEENESDVESAPVHPALRHLRCVNEHEMTDSEEAQKRWAQTEKYAADLRKASSASPPKMRAKCTSRYFKILVAGASGTGKTTFIQNLASAYGSSDEGAPAMTESPSKEGLVESFSIEPTSLEDFKENPDNLCTHVLLKDEAAKVEYTITIQDTPGIYEEGAVADAVARFIKEGNEEYMEFEQTPNRQVPMTSFADTRVDICLYFISPHALLPADIATIERLGSMVPIVPIIAKGDAMTKQELQAFKQHISKALDIGADSSCVYTFLPDDIQEAGLDSMTQVFSVISSCFVDESVGRHWPVRSYPWGTAEALSSSHSDVPALKRLLIELSFDDIKACTESSYHEFRKEQLSLRTGSAAFVEAKDASTYTEGASVMPPELEQKGLFTPVLVQKYVKGAFPDAPLAQKTDNATAATALFGLQEKPGKSAADLLSAGQGPAASKPAIQQNRIAAKAPASAGSAPPLACQRSSASEPSWDWERMWEIIGCIFGLTIFMLLVGGITWGLSTVIEKRFGEAHRAEEIRKLDREAEHIARHLHKGCMPELDMESLYASLPSRNREVWALIRLTEAMAQTEGRSGAVCMQERGALAYQASLARAEMAAQEAGHLGRLRAEVKIATRRTAQQLCSSAAHLTSKLSSRLDEAMKRLSQKLPIKTRDGNLNVDMKAIGRVIWRSTIMHMFR